MNFIKKILAEKVGMSLIDISKNFNVREFLKLYTTTLDWSTDQIEAYQVNKIKELLAYSYKHVPFYKKRFDESGFDASKFSYLDELKKIPPLTRYDLQNHNEEILSDEKNKFIVSKGSSSGSTGEPIRYYHDQFGKSANKAAVMFSKILGGYQFGDPWIMIWGNPTAVNVDWKKLSSKISKFLFNEARFPAYQLNKKENFEELFSLFQKKIPKFVYGYTNAIYLFSKFIGESSLTLNTEINGVFCTAENLHDFQRATIEKHLGKVYDHYGCSEINGIAAQTIYDDYYSILEPHVYVEFEKLPGTSKSAKFLITHLHNRVFPLIRYENGDMAVPAENINKNTMRLKFSKIKSIDGRLSDIIVLPDGGNLVVPSFFGSRMLKEISGVKQYQIIQTTPNELRVNLITDADFKEEYKKVVLSTLNEYLKGVIKFEVVYNAPIIKSKNNKFKLLIKQFDNR